MRSEVDGLVSWDELARIDHLKPPLDRKAVGEALAEHWRMLGQPLPELTWVADATHALQLAARDGLSLAWVNRLRNIRARLRACLLNNNLREIDEVRRLTAMRLWNVTRSPADQQVYDASWLRVKNPDFVNQRDLAWLHELVACAAGWHQAGERMHESKLKKRLLRHVQLFYPFVTAFLSGLWLVIPTEWALLLVPRPRMRLAERQLHCASGPAAWWPGGRKFWFWHGAQSTRAVIEYPERITLPQIDRQWDPAVRRLMMERYGLGRWVRDSSASVVDEITFDHPVHGVRGARLFRCSHELYRRPLCYVECINSTPDADGSHRRYLLAVNPRRYRGRAGRCALAALASTWRVSPVAPNRLVFASPEDYRFTCGES